MNKFSEIDSPSWALPEDEGLLSIEMLLDEAELLSIFATMRAFQLISVVHFPMAQFRISLSFLDVDTIPEKFPDKCALINLILSADDKYDISDSKGFLDLSQITKQRSIVLLFFKILEIPPTSSVSLLDVNVTKQSEILQ